MGRVKATSRVYATHQLLLFGSLFRDLGHLVSLKTEQLYLAASTLTVAMPHRRAAAESKVNLRARPANVMSGGSGGRVVMGGLGAGGMAERARVAWVERRRGVHLISLWLVAVLLLKWRNAARAHFVSSGAAGYRR